MECAVYYPDVVPPSPWIKQTLLYWDAVGSVVHRDFWDDPDPELAWLVDAGVYETISVDDIGSVGSRRLIDEFVEVVAHYDATGIDWEPTDRTGTILHYGKLPELVEAQLQVLNVIKPDSAGLLINPKLLAPLICLAAKHLCVEFKSRKRDYSLHTTSKSASATCFEPTSDGDHQEAMKLVLSGVLPCPGDAVTFQEIIDFKKDYQTELLAFRSAIHEAIYAVTQESDNLAHVVRRVCDKIELEHRTISRKMKQRNWLLGSSGAVTVIATAAGQRYLPDATEWMLDGIATATIVAAIARIRSGPVPQFSYLYSARHLSSR